ncbi:MAG TPA: SRPBCC family protein [Thermoleophilaceae bacterium]|nr:SRPBCC family protein [Thermoleophilaceae bacterium]
MNPTHQVRVATEIDAPAADVWARVSEHEDTPSWVEAAKRVTLERAGEADRNGLGAIRVVEFKPRLWSTIHEEIVGFDPPRAFEYVLFKGMPGLRDHLGRVAVDDLGQDRSRLRWEVDFEFRTVHPFRPFVPSFVRDFEGVLREALASLKGQLEPRAVTASR